MAQSRRASGIVGDDERRFWFYVDKREPDECWLWTGTPLGNRYGVLGIAGRMVLAHRYSYELAHGPIPDELEIDHVWKRGCRHTLCVNPAHLEAVTRRENLRRIADMHTHCPSGHPYDEENTYWRPDGRGKDCLLCRRARAREAQRRWRAANVAAGLTPKGKVRV